MYIVFELYIYSACIEDINLSEIHSFGITFMKYILMNSRSRRQLTRGSDCVMVKLLAFGARDQGFQVAI